MGIGWWVKLVEIYFVFGIYFFSILKVVLGLWCGSVVVIKINCFFGIDIVWLNFFWLVGVKFFGFFVGCLVWLFDIVLFWRVLCFLDIFCCFVKCVCFFFVFKLLIFLKKLRIFYIIFFLLVIRKLVLLVIIIWILFRVFSL